MAEFAIHFHIRPWEWRELGLVETYVLLVTADVIREKGPVR